MGSGATTASHDLVPDHAYAVVGYNPSSANPFTVYNPWGTTSAGWAPYQYNGSNVYGQFNANQAFLTANFTPVNQTNSPTDGWYPCRAALRNTGRGRPRMAQI